MTYRDGQIVAASQLSNLASVTEGSTHDNGLVAELLVVVVDALDGSDTRVLLLAVLLLVGGLEPVENAADKGRDEVSVGLGSANGLDQREHERQVAVDAMVALQNLSSLDTLPGGGDLDQNAVLGDALLLVQLRKVSAAMSDLGLSRREMTHVNDVQSLVHRLLGVKGETGIDLGGDLAGNDLEDLLAEFDK